MILMVNGPFGVGKTTVASLLNERLDNSMIYDPEEVGFMLRSIIPDEVKHANEKTGDFQDLRLWRKMVVTVAEELVKTYRRNLIIPMTIYDPERFAYIKKGFEETGEQVVHFCLMAKREVIHERLTRRGDEPDSWAFHQTEKCLASFENDPKLFKKLIFTNTADQYEVVQTILDNI